MLAWWGKVVARAPKRVLAVAVVIFAFAAAYGAGVFDALSDGGFEDKTSETYHETRVESDLFGNRGADVVAIYSSATLQATDPQFESIVRTTLARVPTTRVTSIVTYYDSKAPALLGHDGRSTQVLVSLAGDSQDEYLDNYEKIRARLDADGLDTEVTGSFSVYDDVNQITQDDLRRAEMISLPVVLLLSLLIFGSLVAATMPILVGVCAVIGGMALVRIIAGLMDVSVFSINVITLLGLGLAIDYGLFMINRYREELGRGSDIEDAIVTTMSTAGRTVFFSGLTVAAALSSMLVFRLTFLRSMAVGGVAAVIVAMLAAVTVLPAVLRLLGRNIDAGRMPWRRGRAVAVESDHGAWARLAHAVMARPVVVVVVVLVVLGTLASPFLGVRWGSVDYRVLPSDAPAYVGAEKLNTDFGPETSTASIVLRDSTQAAAASYVQAVRALDGVEAAQIVAASSDATNFLVDATWTANAMDERSRDLVKEIRALDPDAGNSLVGGASAFMVDLLHSVGSQLPWMVLIVVVVMMVLLFLAFGSVVLPIKAIVMNVISIVASFGVVTWVFSDGHLEGLLGFKSQGFLDATNPILMLAVLFGLSMDYEVFLLSRVREQWDKTHLNAESVALGVQKTGRIITSAALLLAVVIGAFTTSGIVFMKMIGLGMLVALLVDATIVRLLLVPATMRLLGGWNWWAPAPMKRWWEAHGLRH